METKKLANVRLTHDVYTSGYEVPLGTQFYTNHIPEKSPQSEIVNFTVFNFLSMVEIIC